MTYEQWAAAVPSAIRNDPLWKVEAYRLGLFLSDLAWPDAQRLLKHRLHRDTASQLYRSAANISSNVTEGYSRSSGNDRARFYEYALGSVREVRDWYYKGRRVLADAVVEHRLGLASELIALLVVMVTNERRRTQRVAKGQKT